MMNSCKHVGEKPCCFSPKNSQHEYQEVETLIVDMEEEKQTHKMTRGCRRKHGKQSLSHTSQLQIQSNSKTNIRIALLYIVCYMQDTFNSNFFPINI